MTNKELNATIKKELKEAGYNTKDFSVSIKDCGYSTSINVKVKSPYVNKKEVETLLKRHEAYERDDRTYEVLEGGNTYLFVEYEYGIFETVSQEWAATASGLMKITEEITRIFDGLYLLNMSGHLEVRQQNANGNITKMCDYISLCEYLFKFAQFGTIAV